MNCINCKNEHKEKFCPNCGEKSAVAKITFGSIFNDAFSSITNMDRGFIFNIKSLLIDPRKIVIDYIHGRRKGIFNPVTYLILSVTIYLIGESLIGVSSESREMESKIYSIGIETGRFIQGNFKYYWILSIIWLSASTKLLFGTYNFAEHLTINSFIIGQATLAGIIGFYIFRLPLLLNPLVYIFIIWMTFKIFKSDEENWVVLIQSVVATILFFILLVLVAVFFGVFLS